MYYRKLDVERVKKCINGQIVKKKGKKWSKDRYLLILICKFLNIVRYS